VLGPAHAGSGIVHWAGSDWLATAAQPYASQQYTSNNDAYLVDVQVFHWDGTAWAV
jgi:choline-glycine betaine transporter